MDITKTQPYIQSKTLNEKIRGNYFDFTSILLERTIHRSSRTLGAVVIDFWEDYSGTIYSVGKPIHRDNKKNKDYFLSRAYQYNHRPKIIAYIPSMVLRSPMFKGRVFNG